MGRWIAVFWLSLAAALLPRPAFAQTIDLDAACIVATEAAATPAQVLARKAEWNCRDRKAYAPGRTNWAIFTGLSLAQIPDDPWVYRHSIGRERSTKVFVHFADARIEASPSSLMDARQSFASADMIFKTPRRDAAITGILVRVEDMQAVRGLAPRPQLLTTSALNAEAKGYHIFWGFFFGLVGAILVFNLTLFLVMKHRFQLIYCLFAASTLAFAFSWSGGIFLLLPDLTPFGQIRGNVYTIGLCLLTGPLFLLTFLEPGMLSRKMRGAIMTLAALPLATNILREFSTDAMWWRFDMVFYSLMLANVAFMALAMLQAWWRGSQTVKFILFGWSVTYALVFVRGLWALNGVTLHTGLFDLSPFMAIAFEASVSAVGMGWRIRELRRERDQARGHEKALIQLADTDSLTGLLNRRAFIERITGCGAAALILIDIDRFKAINDAHGHSCGDEVLERLGRVLADAESNGAIAARIGGEEFALLAPPQLAAAIAESVRQSAMRITLPDLSVVTVSAGIAYGALACEEDWRHLYIAADQTLYRAKSGGRNRVEIAAEPGPQTLAA